jgi:hypothetical protein
MLPLDGYLSEDPIFEVPSLECLDTAKSGGPKIIDDAFTLTAADNRHASFLLRFL